VAKTTNAPQKDLLPFSLTRLTSEISYNGVVGNDLWWRLWEGLGEAFLEMDGIWSVGRSWRLLQGVPFGDLAPKENIESAVSARRGSACVTGAKKPNLASHLLCQ
jgi:hypothetical protein